MAEDVRAEIVASVLEVVVNEGDQIGKGDTVVLLESMKMEIPVLAETDGTDQQGQRVGGRRHSGGRSHSGHQLAVGRHKFPAAG
jgi:acetyl/propionyl-CoA carboxylase alpha subunit